MEPEQEIVSGEIEAAAVTALAQREVDFYGTTLIAVQTEAGVCVPVKPICEALGLDWAAQHRRIKNDEVLRAVVVVTTTIGADGRQRPMLCLPDHMLHGWLFGMSADRIRPEFRERLTRYKREAYAVLHAVFAGAALPAPAPAAPPAQLAGLVAQVNALAVQVAALRAERGAAAEREQRLLTAESPDGLSAALILKTLREAAMPLPPFLVRQLLHDAGHGPFASHRISTRMLRMAERGQVVRHADGRYSPPDEAQP